MAEYRYRDLGSLVALGMFSPVSSLMGGALMSGSVMIEGVMARLVFWSLHKMHQVALNGYYRTALGTLTNLIK